MVSNRHPFSFNFIFGNRKKSQGAKSGEYGGWGMTAILLFVRNCWMRMEVCEMGRCHGEAARSDLTKVWGDVFTHFHAVGTNSLCTIPLTSKKVMIMFLTLLFTCLAFFGLGDMGLFHWEDCCLV